MYKRRRIHRLIAASFAASAGVALAQGLGEAEAPASKENSKEKIAYKVTAMLLSTRNQRDAGDLNVRANLDAHTAWVGYYHRPSEFQQLRAGYEYQWEVPFGRIVPSLQVATHGFLGGSVTAEIGHRNFALIGFGRTNLKPYYNLNFDPNDAITLGIGTRAIPKTQLTLFQVRDDRLGTGQKIVHAIARVKADERTRWTLDVFYKEGTSADGDDWIRATGVAVTYDFEPYFVRVAHDPHVNFTRDRMLRLSFGLRL